MKGIFGIGSAAWFLMGIIAIIAGKDTNHPAIMGTILFVGYAILSRLDEK